MSIYLSKDLHNKFIKKAKASKKYIGVSKKLNQSAFIRDLVMQYIGAK